jgi:hypothetical protein
LIPKANLKAGVPKKVARLCVFEMVLQPGKTPTKNTLGKPKQMN